MSGAPSRLALQKTGLLPMAVLTPRGKDLNPKFGPEVTAHHNQIILNTNYLSISNIKI